MKLKIDTSSEGLEAFLKQNHRSLENPHWHSIGYWSSVLHDYEKRYAQVEKETVSIVFGVERFQNIYMVVNLP